MIGGAETMNAVIANRLAKEVNSNVYFIVFRPGEIVDRLNKNINVIVLDTKKSIKCVKILVELFDSLRGNKLLISSVTGVNFVAAFSVLIWRIKKVFSKQNQKRKDLKIDFICWEVNPLHVRLYQNKFTKIKIRFTHFISTKLIVISDDIYKEFSRILGHSEKIYLLGCPVVSLEEKYSPHKVGANCDERFIITVARHHPQKDLLLLVKVYYHLKNLGFDKKLKLYGHTSDQYTPAIKGLIEELDLTENILMFEPVENIKDEQKNAEFLLHTAAWEGLGNALIEAISVGTPVVATNCPGGIGDYLISGKNGLLLEGRDPKQIAKQIMKNMPMLISLKGSDMRETILKFDQSYVINKMLVM